MKENNWKVEIKANTKNLKFWTFLWVISMAFATFGPLFIWSENTALNVVAIIVNIGFGAGMIIANRKYIKSLDELQKKIQMDAMGIALGVGIVGGLAYSLLDQSNVIRQDAQISYLVILISFTYMIGLFIGQKRYK